MKNEIDRLTNERAEREREANDASTKLEAARSAYKNERSPAAYKALESAQRESERAKLAHQGVTEALEQAQAQQAEAERAAQVEAYEQSLAVWSVAAFRIQAEPIAKKLAELARETADLSVQGAELSARFESKAAQTRSRAVELGLTPNPAPAFVKIFGAVSAMAAGKTPADALALFFGVEPAPGVEPAEQLTLAFQGQDPKEVTDLLAQLREAETRRSHAVRKVLNEGSGLGTNASPTPLGSFLGVSRECERHRARLTELGFGGSAAQVHSDALADELSAVDTKLACSLIDQHKAADYMRATEAQQGRKANADDAEAECAGLKLKLAELGCAEIAAALPRMNFGSGNAGGGLTAFAAY